MTTIEIFATTGNKYLAHTLKHYKRGLTIANVTRDDSGYIFTFDQAQKDRFIEFVNRMNHQGGSESYFIHFIAEDKWFESRIIEEESDLQIRFEVYTEGKRKLAKYIEV